MSFKVQRRIRIGIMSKAEKEERDLKKAEKESKSGNKPEENKDEK